MVAVSACALLIWWALLGEHSSCASTVAHANSPTASKHAAIRFSAMRMYVCCLYANSAGQLRLPSLFAFELPHTPLHPPACLLSAAVAYNKFGTITAMRSLSVLRASATFLHSMCCGCARICFSGPAKHLCARSDSACANNNILVAPQFIGYADQMLASLDLGISVDGLWNCHPAAHV